MQTRISQRPFNRIGPILCLILAPMLLIAAILIAGQFSTQASSHREAPLISNDPFVDNTDTYVFVSPTNPDNLVLIASWIPFEGPEGGPNYYEWDDNAAYEIHVDNNGDAVADYTYMLTSETVVQNPLTFLYNVGPIGADGANWNRQQRYSVKEMSAAGMETLVDNMLAPPVNIGSKSTPDYEALADNFIYTVNNNGDDISIYAGQTDDPFWVDLQVFDLLTLRGQAPPIGYSEGNNSPIDSLAGFNVHTLVIEVPISRLTQGDEPVLGVWATASRRSMRVLNGLAGLTTPAQPTETTFKVGLTGEAEVPGPGDADGTGEAVLTFNRQSYEVCYTLSTANIDTPTAGHIHEGAVDAAGGVAIGLFSDAADAASGCAQSDEATVNAILDNPSGFYVNIHNAEFAPGAIRGQLGQTVSMFNVGLSGDAEVPGPGDPDGTGEAMLTFYPDNGLVCYTLATNNVDAPSAGHIHEGAADAAGGVAIGLFSDNADAAGGCVESDADTINNILASPANFYVNIHNAAFPAGAIRGQVGQTSSMFTVALTGDAEVPGPGDADGTGEAVLTFYPDNALVCYDLTTENIDPPSAGHIHEGAIDAAGGVAIGLFSDNADAASGCAVSDAATVNGILADPEGFYVNIHNAEFAPGAIRGQLGQADQPEMPAPPGLETHSGDFVQVSRLGMPLVNEAVLPLALKDAFNGLMPSQDLGVYVDPVLGEILQTSVEDPELGRLLCGLYGVPLPGDTDDDCSTEVEIGTPRSGRGDIFDIFLTGMVLANEFTIETAGGPVTLPAGFNVNQPANVQPAEMIRINTAISGDLCSPTPSRLGVLGGDACGFPNGRRLIDDVVEIELLAVAGAAYAVLDGRDSDFAFNAGLISVLDDGVYENDIAFRSDFPYVAAAQSGQEHLHTNPVQNTATPMPTATPMATDTPVPTATPTVMDTPTDIPTATETPLPTETPTPVDTSTSVPTLTPPPTFTFQPTFTPLPSNTPTPRPTWTLVPTQTPEPTWTLTPLPPTATLPPPTATATVTPTGTAIDTATPVPTNTLVPTNTPLPTNTLLPTNTAVPTHTPLPTSTAIPTGTATNVPTAIPTNTPMPADLVGTVAANSAEIALDGTATWRIELMNEGELSATEIMLIVELPVGTELASVSQASGWSCSDGLARSQPDEDAADTCRLALDDLSGGSSVNTFISVIPAEEFSSTQIQEPGILVQSAENPDGMNISVGVGNNIRVTQTPTDINESNEPQQDRHNIYLPMIAR